MILSLIITVYEKLAFGIHNNEIFSYGSVMSISINVYHCCGANCHEWLILLDLLIKVCPLVTIYTWANLLLELS